MSEEVKKNSYSADSIQALEGMEHVRMRPSMYIGDTGVRGLHHLVYEVVDNSIDEAMAGHCDTIKVTITKEGSITTEDNGRGSYIFRRYGSSMQKKFLELVVFRLSHPLLPISHDIISLQTQSHAHHFHLAHGDSFF